MDKSEKKLGNFHSGKKLRCAREIKRLQLIDLAEGLEATVVLVQKWQQRGVPRKVESVVSRYFGVEEWVFTDETLTEEIFKQIIFDPKLQDKYRPANRPKGPSSPVLIATFKSKNTGRILETDSFYVSNKTVLISGRVWEREGVTFTQISLCDEHEEDRKQRYMKLGFSRHDIDPTLRICTEYDTKPTDEIIQEKIINGVKEGSYHLSVHPDYFFEISVYEMTTYQMT